MENPNPNLRVMVDANILIAGTLWPRWAHEVLLHAIKGDFTLILTPYIIAQARKRVQNRFPGGVSRLEEMLKLLDYELAENPTEEDVRSASSLVRDPTDIPVALAAIHANVDYLVSEDKDLTAEDETTQELRRHLIVLIAGTFLREVMGWGSEPLEKVRGRTWKDLDESENE